MTELQTKNGESEEVAKWPSTRVENMTNKETFQLLLKLNGYKPGDINIETMEGRMLVEARHTDMHTDKTVSHHFTYEYLLPKDVDPNDVNASWSPKHQALSIKAPRGVRSGGK